MVVIPGGEFDMGSSEKRAFSDELPRHSVKVEPFLISKHPITKAQWKAGAELAAVHQELKKVPIRRGSSSHPVVAISWYEAVEFCERLRQKTGHNYRLPTESEWEYACRAGTTSPFHFGETITANLANYDGSYTYGLELKGINREKFISVFELQTANDFGLFGMHGNIWEWCLDQWHESYEGAPSNGSAWIGTSNDENNPYRVLRGGSWRNEPLRCRSSSRWKKCANDIFDHVGFRIVRSI
jgi:formylglycine-generating enzyme required for sulfatase activity